MRGLAGLRKQGPKTPGAGVLIADPRAHFSKLYAAGRNLTEQAYALVTRDPAGALGFSRSLNVGFRPIWRPARTRSPAP
jgi:hypothetical protein